MRRMLKIAFLVTIPFMLTACLGGTFTLKSSMTKGAGPAQVRIPYANTVDYFGYVSPSVKPDGKYKGKDTFYLYFWVPAVIDEVGVSMYSPADKAPGANDFKHKLYDTEIAKDADKFFDTYLVLEKLKIFSPEKIKKGGSVMSTLKYNDDTGEIPANPGGRKYNSLLRHKSEVSNPLKALVRGVYRVSFTSFRGSVQGSYIATIGTNIPGVKIASSLEELHTLVNN